MTNHEIKKQINLAIRTMNDPQGLAVAHMKRAFELFCELEQTSPATRQGRTIPATIGQPVPASGVRIVSQNDEPEKTESFGWTKKARLVHAMARRGYPVTGSTLIKEAGITRKSLSQHLNTLRKEGYIIRCERTGLNEGKYMLVKSA